MKNRALLAFASLLAVLVVFAVHSLDFPGSVPDFVRSSGGGVLLDAKPAFSEEAIYHRLTNYGSEGEVTMHSGTAQSTCCCLSRYSRLCFY